ncbi:reticulon family protein [Hibiscus syriacus]|uniref:Reticulon family protein n=1 Tax=Hibiscus syriacus TaxID=106335 RepID=A0A6A2ZIX7_HIBSY|nr:reticulon family protein [Hibiscus syriacus]
MAVNVSSACFSVVSYKKVKRIKGVASEDFAALRTEEEKVKIGGSELRVTRLGIGAWSWGDTTYWNSSGWDDRKLKAAKAAFDASVDQNPPTGPRARIYTSEFLTKLQPLLNGINEIGENYGKTPTQVVLNWLIAQENVVPIPGAKTAEQAEEFSGALGWRLSNDEVDELRSLASKIGPVPSSPVENL